MPSNTLFPRLTAVAAVLLFAVQPTTSTAQAVTGSTGNSLAFSNVQPALAITYLIATSGIFPSGGVLYGSNNEPYLGEIRMFAGNFAPSGYEEADGGFRPIAQNTALFALLGTRFGGNGTTDFRLPDLSARTIMGAGEGPGLTAYALGEVSGSHFMELLPANLPPHAHSLSSGSTGSAGSGQPFDNRQPALALDVQITTAGGPYDVGMVSCFPYSRFPDNNGAVLPVSGNENLSAMLGTAYGIGGFDTFVLPDFRGRLVVGAGQGTGLSSRGIGETGGDEATTLGLSQMPQHSHAIPAIPGGNTGLAGNSQPVPNLQPYLSVRYYICVSGNFPFSGSPTESPFIGEIRAFAVSESSGPDQNVWLPADGRLLAVNSNQSLFSILFNTFGGDATTTFALPDLRGRVPVGVSGFALRGDKIGSEAQVLSVSNLPAHTHTLPAVDITPSVSDISATGATIYGKVSSDGGSAISQRGFVLAPTAANPNPRIGGTNVTQWTNAGTTGIFSVNATGLTPGTSYTFAAYASNGAGPTYTSNTAFTTLTEIENWRNTWYGSTTNAGRGADNADPYGTGVPNLLAFAFLGPAQNPALARASQLPVWEPNGIGFIASKFTQPAGVGPITYTAEFSTTLAPGSWTNIPNTGAGSTRLFEISTVGRSNLFLRMRVVR
jgi:microcystin-dependent protein